MSTGLRAADGKMVHYPETSTKGLDDDWTTLSVLFSADFCICMSFLLDDESND